MTAGRRRPPGGQPGDAAAGVGRDQGDDTISHARVLTPWHATPTFELADARDRLTRWYHEVAPDDPHREVVGDLVVWSTLELAERLATFVRIAHAGGAPAYGAALEALAYDTGVAEPRTVKTVGGRPKPPTLHETSYPPSTQTFWWRWPAGRPPHHGEGR